MTAQPGMTGFGMPPAAPSGFRKFTPFLASAATGGALVVLGMYIAQLSLPTKASPGYVAGTAAGSETLGHLQTSGDEQISYETRTAGAAATVPLIAGALDGQTVISNGADIACAAGSMGAKIAADQRPVWDSRDSQSEWWYRTLRSVADATCGVGSAVRSNMVAELTGGARAAGGLSARNSAPMVREVSAPAPQPIAHSLADVFAITTPSRHYDWDDVTKARRYVKTLPSDVQDKLWAGITDEHSGFDVFTDRTRAYIVATSIK